MNQKISEAVNSPKHYNSGQIETIDYIESLGIGEDFCVGNAIKYLSRYKHKGVPLQDLHKAKWYIERTIKYYEDLQKKKAGMTLPFNCKDKIIS